MSVIKKELLTPALKAKYPGAITYRTHEMVDRVSSTANIAGAPTPASEQPKKKNVSSMNKTELLNYIAEFEYDIETETIYNTVDKLRKAIASYEEDSVAFLKEQADIKAELDLKNTLAELNPSSEEGEPDIEG